MSTDPKWRISVGEQLRKARLNAGHSQEWVALEADLDRSYLSQLENGLKSPTLDMLSKICHAIGIRVSELIAAAEQADGV